MVISSASGSCYVRSVMEADVRALLQSILNRLDAQGARLDAIDASATPTRDEAPTACDEAPSRRDQAPGARDEMRQLESDVIVIAQELEHLSGLVADIVGAQAETSKSIAALAASVHAMNERERQWCALDAERTR